MIKQKNNEDDEMVTKGYLRMELKDIRENMATKDDIKTINISIEKSFDHYFPKRSES